MDEKTLYDTPIKNSLGAVTLVNQCGLIYPGYQCTVIFLDENDKPLYPEDAKNNPKCLNGLIVVHRRTGDPHPTDEEIKTADAWRKTLALTDIRFVDYIIICGGSHYSFAAEKVVGPGV